MTITPESRILDHLAFLYGAERVPVLLERLRGVLDRFRRRG